jgi:mono/diheme cytochrome c family protein
MKRRNGTRTAGTVLVAALSLAAGVAGCAGGRASVPTADELSAAGALPRGADVDAIRRGRVIFVTECGACHRLYLPGEYSPEEWRPIARRMGERASLGSDQVEDLTRYLTAASRAAR